MDSSPLGIINIRLKTINSNSDPAELVHQYLKIFFSENLGNLVYHLCDLEVNPTNPDSLERYQHALDNIVAQVER